MKHPITTIDNAQIMRYSYDDENQASRVVVVGLDIGDAIKDAFSKIEFPIAPTFVPNQIDSNSTTASAPIYIDKIIKEIQPVIIEKNVFIPQIQVVEKQVVVRDVQIVHVPEYITIHKTEVIEKPIIIKEYEKIPNLLKYSAYIFVCLEFINLIKSLVK